MASTYMINALVKMRSCARGQQNGCLARMMQEDDDAEMSDAAYSALLRLAAAPEEGSLAANGRG